MQDIEELVYLALQKDQDAFTHLFNSFKSSIGYNYSTYLNSLGLISYSEWEQECSQLLEDAMVSYRPDKVSSFAHFYRLLIKRRAERMRQSSKRYDPSQSYEKVIYLDSYIADGTTPWADLICDQERNMHESTLARINARDVLRAIYEKVGKKDFEILLKLADGKPKTEIIRESKIGRERFYNLLRTARQVASEFDTHS